MENLRNVRDPKLLKTLLKEIVLKKDLNFNLFLLEIFSSKASGFLFKKNYWEVVVEFLKSDFFLNFTRENTQKFLVKRNLKNSVEFSLQEYYFYSFAFSIVQISTVLQSNPSTLSDFTFQGYYELVKVYLDYALSGNVLKEKGFIVGKLNNFCALLARYYSTAMRCYNNLSIQVIIAF
jgi:hypothetical protein